MSVSSQDENSPYLSDLPDSTNPSDYNDSDSDSESEIKIKYPYIVGYTFMAFQHTADPPFGYRYDTPRPEYKHGWDETSPLDYCLLPSPLQGHTETLPAKRLQITSDIRTGNNCGAQVVVVNETMVAKIYGPLFYPQFDAYGIAHNMMRLADSDYTRKAGAYRELQESGKSLHIPKYYGSWTMSVETQIWRGVKKGSHMRTVRLILLKYIKGTPMNEINLEELSCVKRRNILRLILHAEAAIHHAGVSYLDLAPRNVIISDPRKGSSLHIITIIDFNASIVMRLGDTAEDYYLRMQSYLNRYPGKMLSPALRFWNSDLAEFSAEGWLSSKEGKGRKWLLKHMWSTKRYVPMTMCHVYGFEVPELVGWDELWKEFWVKRGKKVGATAENLSPCSSF